MGKVSVSGEIRWSPVTPRIAFEKVTIGTSEVGDVDKRIGQSP